MKNKRVHSVTSGAVLAGSLPCFFSYTEKAKADNSGAIFDVESNNETLSESLKVIKVPAIIAVVGSLGVFIVYKIFQFRIISYLQKFIDDYDASVIGGKLDRAGKKTFLRELSLEDERVFFDLLIEVKKTGLEELKEIFKEVEEIAKDVWVNKGYDQKTNEVGLGSDFLNTEKLTVLGEDVIFKKDEELVPRLLKIYRVLSNKQKGLLKKDKNRNFLCHGIGFVVDFFENEEFKEVSEGVPGKRRFCLSCVLELMEKEIDENKPEEERKKELESSVRKRDELVKEIQRLRPVAVSEVSDLLQIRDDYNKAKDVVANGVNSLDIFNYSEYMGLRKNFDEWYSNENPA